MFFFPHVNTVETMEPCWCEANIQPNMNSREVSHNFFLYVKHVCPCCTFFTQVSFQIHVSADFCAEDTSPAASVGFREMHESSS